MFLKPQVSFQHPQAHAEWGRGSARPGERGGLSSQGSPTSAKVHDAINSAGPAGGSKEGGPNLEVANLEPGPAGESVNLKHSNRPESSTYLKA